MKRLVWCPFEKLKIQLIDSISRRRKKLCKKMMDFNIASINSNLNSRLFFCWLNPILLYPS